ncbi:MAG: nitroreductase [Bacteroidota bacterium]
MNNEFETLSKIIKERRSIFPVSYIKKEIPTAVIEQILESANYAPTHKLTQPWRFVVIRNEAKARLGAALGARYQETVTSAQFMQKKYDSFAQKTEQAACILAVNIQFHPDLLPEWEEIAATAAAVQNIALTAAALNIGSYWSSPSVIDGLTDFLELQENEKCYGLFYMGYHLDEPRKANRTPMANKVKWLEA